jgi:hypothetical protein
MMWTIVMKNDIMRSIVAPKSSLCLINKSVAWLSWLKLHLQLKLYKHSQIQQFLPFLSFVNKVEDASVFFLSYPEVD